MWAGGRMFRLAALVLVLAPLTALAAENLMLAFQSHGYATCPMEGFDEVRLRQTLYIPRQAIPIMLLAVGKQGDKAIYNPRLRFPLEQHVTWL